MRSLLLRVTISHLLVGLGAVLLVTALSPPLFHRYYIRSEQQRLDAAGRGLASAADRLLSSPANLPNLRLLVTTSAAVMGAEVDLTCGDVHIRAGKATHDPQLSLQYTSRLPGNSGLLVIYKQLTGWQQVASAQRLVNLLAALLASLLAVALAYVSARAMSAPLVSMSQAAQRIADEDFAVRMPEAGPTEVASLARNLNHMAQALEVAFNDMRRLDQLRREFVGNASHELRAPLTSIRGFLDAVLDGTADTPQEREHCLRTASLEAVRMSRIVEELLQLSRLQAGVLEFELAPVDLTSVAQHVATSFRNRVQERGVRVELRAERMPLAEVDANKLAQVMVNLLDNALRYSPDGGLITLSLDQERDGIRLAVADEGPGIPEASLAEIWERFHKADPARRRTEHGAGLGLAIAREIIGRHNGEVFARNRAEGGAEVGFWVPLRQIN